MGPYEFKDYFKFGAPLQVLFLCLGIFRAKTLFEMGWLRFIDFFRD